MDADDISDPKRFESQLAWIGHTKSHICGTWIKTFGASSRIVKYPIDHDEISIAMLFGSPLAHPSVLGNAKAFKLHLYKKGWNGAEDYELWERMDSEGILFTNVPEVLLKYRHHSNQESSKNFLIQNDLTRQIQLRRAENGCHKLNITSSSIKNYILNRGLKNSTHNQPIDNFFIQILRDQNLEKSQTIKKEFKEYYFYQAMYDCHTYKRFFKILKKTNLTVDLSDKLFISILCLITFVKLLVRKNINS
jgi:hypothetical protein